MVLDRYEQKIINHGKTQEKMPVNCFKKSIKTREPTGDLIRNKAADKIKNVSNVCYVCLVHISLMIIQLSLIEI